MIEKTVLNYLSEKLTVPVYMEIPENKEDEFVVLEKTGSSRSEKINTAVFAIKSYAQTLVGAAELNEKVKAAMDEIISLDEICSASLNSDYDFTDSASKQYRYQAVYDIIHY
jgi:hypothetical protein